MESRSFTPNPVSPDHKTPQLSSPSSNAKNRESNGIEKFIIAQQKKQAEAEIILVQNKINLLLKLETDARKKTEIARKKAEEIKKIKARNELKEKEKEILKEEKKKEEDLQRKKNYEERKKRTHEIKNLQNTIFREKQEFAKEVKKQKKKFDELSTSFREMIKKQKNQIKNTRIAEVNNFKAKSDFFAYKIMENLKQTYKDKIEREKQEYLMILDQKKELEKKEAEVIQSYTKTLSFERETFQKLENVANVPIFNLGFRTIHLERNNSLKI